ncbi:hypothetical protein AAMO2058_001076800 [Amorphochlora amoebiformis]
MGGVCVPARQPAQQSRGHEGRSRGGRISDEWTRGEQVEIRSDSIVKRIREQLRTSQDSLALLSNRGVRLTFKQMDDICLEVSHAILQSIRDPSPHPIAIVCCDDSISTPIAALSCLYSSTIYVPIPPNDPPDRLCSVISRLNPGVILLHGDPTGAYNLNEKILEERFGSIVIKLVEFPKSGKKASIVSGETTKPHHPCWIHFTSGSTGMPKGVCVTQGAVTQRCCHKASLLGYSRGSRVLIATPYTFDPYASDLFSTLMHGGCVVSATRADILSGLPAIINDTKTTHVCTTPSMWLANSADPQQLQSLKVLTLIGERMPLSMMQRWADVGSIRLLNMYGVTEATDTQLTCDISAMLPHARTPGCVGTPDPNCVIKLLQQNQSLSESNQHTSPETKTVSEPKDHSESNTPSEPNLNPPSELKNTSESKEKSVSGWGWPNSEEEGRGDGFEGGYVGTVGEVGEVLIGGPQVAEGYFGLPDETRRRFVYIKGKGRFYRTGDLAYWRPDGHLELMGRNDSQVKILGKRVEISEVTSIAEEHPAISKAATVFDKKQGRLTLFIEPKGIPFSCQSNPSLHQCLDWCMYGLGEAVTVYCRHRLPRHMVPQVRVFPRLNLTHSGKVDKKSLLQRPYPPTTVLNAYQDLPESRERRDDKHTAVHQLVSSVWRAELLGENEKVIFGRELDFYEMGGDSLAGLRVCKVLAVAFGLGERYVHPTFGTIKGPFAVGELMQRSGLGDYVAFLLSQGLQAPSEAAVMRASTKIRKMKKCVNLSKRSSIPEDSKNPTDSKNVQPGDRLSIALRSAVRIDWGIGVSALARARCDVNGGIRRSNPGSSPLHVAAKFDNLSAARALLEEKANVNAITAHRESPLHVASGIGKKDPNVLRLLIHHPQSNIHVRDANTQSLLHVASRSGSTQALAVILDTLDMERALSGKKARKGRQMIHSFDRWGRSPLHWAVLNGHKECVKLLLDAKASPLLAMSSAATKKRTHLTQESSAELAIRVHGKESDMIRLLRKVTRTDLAKAKNRSVQ